MADSNAADRVSGSEEYFDVSMVTNVGSLIEEDVDPADRATDNLPSTEGDVLVRTVLMAADGPVNNVSASSPTERNDSPAIEPNSVDASSEQNDSPPSELNSVDASSEQNDSSPSELDSVDASSEQNDSPPSELDSVDACTKQNDSPPSESDNVDVSSPTEQINSPTGELDKCVSYSLTTVMEEGEIIGASPFNVSTENGQDCDNRNSRERKEDASSSNISLTVWQESLITTSVDDRPTIGSSTTSIYLDAGDGAGQTQEKKTQRPMRLTNAQRATMEALASFGGVGLASIPVRKIDLRSELRSEAEKEKNKKRKLEEVEGVEPPRKVLRTRLQRAKKESEDIFQDIPLATTLNKKSTLRKYEVKKSSESPQGLPKVKSRLTRAERSKLEALESFGGVSLDLLQSVAKPTKVSASETTSTQPARRLTRAERARLEALQSFGGSGLQDVMKGAKRRDARTLEKCKPNKATDERVSGEEVLEEKENVSSSPMATNA